jgi:hypothetical protein
MLCFVLLSCLVFVSYSLCIACFVMSCTHLLSCPVLSCPVLSCPVLSCPVLSCPVLSCPVLSCLVFVLVSYSLCVSCFVPCTVLQSLSMSSSLTLSGLGIKCCPPVFVSVPVPVFHPVSVPILFPVSVWVPNVVMSSVVILSLTSRRRCPVAVSACASCTVLSYTVLLSLSLFLLLPLSSAVKSCVVMPPGLLLTCLCLGIV